MKINRTPNTASLSKKKSQPRGMGFTEILAECKKILENEEKAVEATASKKEI